MIEMTLTALLCFITGWVLGHFGMKLLGRAILDGKLDASKVESK